MPRITFTETRVVNDQFKGTDKETRFLAGETYDLPRPSCERWKLRGLAIDAIDGDEGGFLVPEELHGVVRAVLSGDVTHVDEHGIHRAGDPLDHDKDGRKGGSRPKAQRKPKEPAGDSRADGPPVPSSPPSHNPVG